MKTNASILLILFSCVALSLSLEQDSNDRINTATTNWQERLREKLKPLANLGQLIRQRVHQSLKPVRILQNIHRVKQGIYGETVATYGNNEKQLIIRNGRYYECDVGLVDDRCYGELLKFEFKTQEDFCYATPHLSYINHWFCIKTSPSGITSYINGRITCKSYDKSPILLISANDYKRLCGSLGRVYYKYTTRNLLQDFGSGLHCLGNNPQVCTYSESIGGNKRYRGSGIYISN